MDNPKYNQEHFRELLKRSNKADYTAILKKANEKAKCELPPETPIKYNVIRTCDMLSGIGHVLSGTVELPDGNLIAIMFRRWTKEKDGTVHADHEVLLIRGGYSLCPNVGEFMLEESTVGDRETFYKYINAIPLYLDGRGYLVKNPKELVGTDKETNDE